jgi:hypothetical protein
MKAKRNTLTNSGQSIPNWKIVQPNMVPITVDGQVKDYKRLFWEAQYFVHYEVSDKQLADSFVKYAEKHFNKSTIPLLRKLPDWKFNPIGKLTYLFYKGVGLTEANIALIEQKYKSLLELVKKQENFRTLEQEQKELKKDRSSVSIQQRMRDQMMDMCDQIDSKLQDIISEKINIKQFDPYKIITAQSWIKPAHAKIIKELYQKEFDEAQLVVEWKDEQIKEGYSYMTARIRRDFLEFYEKLFTACDAVINVGKSNRKPRKKKTLSKEKLVSKLKYKLDEPKLALVSLNPMSIVNANTLWVFNTKNRKLGIYEADSMQKSLSVRGSTIVGFDPKKSTQKTVRKPEILKGSDKLPKTKIQKLYNEIRSTETMMNGRINEHVILLRVF